MKRARQVLGLFFQFMKFGLFTFGGGWSIVAQMQKLYVEQEKVITSEELLDLTSVGRSLPGTMIGNVAMLYGYRVAGVAGGMACLFGMILPVVPIMISAVLGMVGSAFRYPPCYAVMLLVIALYLFFNVNCVYLVVIGAVCGLLIAEFYERKGDKKHDGAA